MSERELTEAGIVPVDIMPGCLYHAIWYWSLDDVLIVLIGVRDAEAWKICLHSYNSTKVWTAPLDCDRANVEGAMDAVYGCGVRAARETGCDLAPVVKLSLNCDGAKVPELLQGYAKLGRMPKGAKFA